MVAINKIFFAGALAAAVSAAPLSASAEAEITVPESSQTLAVSEANTILQIEALVSGKGLNKRDDAGVQSLTILLNQTGAFLADTVKNLLSLNLSKESDSLAKLLINVNQFLLNLETDLKNYTPATGLGGLLQTVLVQSGLQSVVLGLSTIISILVTSLLKGGKPDPAVIAQIQEIQAHLSNISSQSQAKGLLGGLTTLVSDLLKSVQNLLNNLLNA
ncbi:hypothetical protein D0Z03_001473 [Geotrichum reessii]|nr:hypothetical protein D0Z03_001473 [Galactomyces reessii]